MKIVETKNFVLGSHDAPEVSRTDGGHLVVWPKVEVEDRTKLSRDLVIEMALLTQLAGKAMVEGMAKRGVKIGRINYQDNGNWSPRMHIHLYGRSPDATYQIYGEPIIAPRKKEDKVVQEALDEGDLEAIREVALRLGELSEYADLGVE